MTLTHLCITHKIDLGLPGNLAMGVMRDDVKELSTTVQTPSAVMRWKAKGGRTSAQHQTFQCHVRRRCACTG